MINKFKKTLLCSTLAVLTVACSSNVDDETPAANVESEVQVNDAATNDVSAEQPEKVVEAQDKVSSMPLDEYIDINSFEDSNYLTTMFLAQTTREMSDEDKLGLMSIEYHNESDRFKKNDLGKTLLPEINQEIDKYKGELGIKIPFGDIYNSFNPYHSTHLKNAEARGGRDVSGGVGGVGGESARVLLKPFDFDKNAFPVHQCLYGTYDGFTLRSYGGNRVSNEQNIAIQYVPVAPDEATFTDETFVPSQYRYTYKAMNCDFEVKDQETARAIEGLRANGKLDTKGFIYYKVTADQNVLIAQPVHAEYTFYNVDTGEDLASGEFNWSKRDDI